MGASVVGLAEYAGVVKWSEEQQLAMFVSSGSKLWISVRLSTELSLFVSKLSCSAYRYRLDGSVKRFMAAAVWGEPVIISERDTSNFAGPLQRRNSSCQRHLNGHRLLLYSMKIDVQWVLEEHTR